MTDTVNTTAVDEQPFSVLALPAVLLSHLDSLGYTRMTAVQAAALPLIAEGRDVIAQAKTGSGKTAAFGIGLLLKLNPRHFGVQAMVLCPTRELADQVANELRKLARYLGNIKIVTLCGGVAMGPQLATLEHGAHIVVGTPGRVGKHLQKTSLDVSGLHTLVLDEADRMLDMGFHDAIADIVGQLPRARQTLLFSATYSDEIRAISRAFQRDAAAVTVEAAHEPAQIAQCFFEVTDAQRDDAVVQLLSHYQPASAVLFCNTKQRCEVLAQHLRKSGFLALALHGDLEQRDRDAVLAQFANGTCPLLVATDVAARGLDIQALAAVINVEPAFEPQVHVHRIGRTGRAGQRGLALTLASEKERLRLEAIEDYQQQTLRWQPLPPLCDQRPAPPQQVTIAIAGGRKDKLRAGDILGALTAAGEIAGTAIGKIDVQTAQTFVALDRAVVARALVLLQEGRIKGRSFRARRLS